MSMNYEDIDFQLITDEDVVEYLLSSLYSDINNIMLRWADKVPPHIMELCQQLHKELNK